VGNPHDSELIAAARTAEAQLSTGAVREEMRDQVHHVLADLAMLDELEQIRLDQANVTDGHFDTAGADDAYANAFRGYGIDVDVLSVDNAGAQIRARMIGTHLAVALDHWALARKAKANETSAQQNSAMKKAPTWKRLLDVAQLADPDYVRGSLREALIKKKSSAELRELGTAAIVEKLPPSTLIMLSDALLEAGALSSSLELLRRGQQRYPADFWIHHRLAFILKNHVKPSRLEEAIACYRVALALRPRSPGVHLNFGSALEAAGELDRAMTCFQEAIRLKIDYAEAYLDLGALLQRKGEVDEAVVQYREVLRIKPDYAEAHNNLGTILAKKGKVDDAMAEFREALRLKKHLAEAHNNLGDALMDKHQLDDAIASYRTAIEFKKDFALAHERLGNALRDKEQLDEAIAEYRTALRLKQDSPEVHLNLGNVLSDTGQIDEAISQYREALRFKKNYALEHVVHYNLGNAFRAKGRLDEAIASYRSALLLQKDYAKAHSSLAFALGEKGQLEEAIAELRQAIKLDPKDAQAHAALGNALCDKKDVAAAIPEIQKAIDLDPKLGAAHCILGQALLSQGRFIEARTATRRGLELLPEPGPGRQMAAQQLQQCERLIQLDGKLRAVLEGKEQPADAAECVAFANLCQTYRQRYRAAAGFFEKAFLEQAGLAANPKSANRYNAACSAVLAGCGQGQDAAGLDEKERGRLRRQALDWLKADLLAWRQLLDNDLKAGPTVTKNLQYWLQDPDFNGVRHGALAKLPEAERQPWRQLWADVTDTLARSQGKPAPPMRPGTR
jgi:tetratricopeptide (TPR) repeat protein